MPSMKPNLACSATFWNLADAFRHAADATFALTRDEWYVAEARIACVFLYFSCIELALKSVLIYDGVPKEEITRKFGHRVSDLLKQAEKFPKFKKLSPSEADRQLVDDYSDLY